MRKAIALTVSLVLFLVSVPCFHSSLAEASDYVGEWVCVAIDLGEGSQTEYDGTDVSELMKIEFGADGSLLLTSFGASIPGTWTETDDGISSVIDDQPVEFAYQGGQLINDSDGVISYLEKAKPEEKKGGLFSLVKGSKYAGNWVAAAMDEGDGELKTEVGGMNVSDLLSLTINKDGTMVLTTMGFDANGTWREISGGISIDIEGQATDMMLEDNQLVGTSDGQTVYFKRASQESSQAAQATPAPIQSTVYTGTWNAVRYETMGYSFGADQIFPDGCTITLREDGTGKAAMGDYTENLTWSEQGGSLTLGGSYVFSAPSWDGSKGELTLCYASDTFLVIFTKEDQAVAEPTAEPIPTVPIPQGENTQQCQTVLFSVQFPSDWVLSDYDLYDGEDYCSTRYNLKDSNDSTLASVYLTASSESVDAYRDRIKQLQGFAENAGKEALDEVVVGGITFSGTEYEDWGWNYIAYTARVVESRITLMINIEQPENIGEALQPILDSITFDLPQLTPPNVDPPLPEDGVPFVPAPSSVQVGDVKLTAAWLKSEQSIVVDSIFDNQIALADGRLYALAGNSLYAYTIVGGQLIPDSVFTNGVMKLDDSFDFLSSASDGILYAAQGFYNVLAIRDGIIVQDNDISGYLVMHPGGKWGLSFWANADPMLIKAKDGVLTEEPWIMSNLSDEEQRKGRFSSISYIAISDNHIYIAGNDALKDDAQRIGVYDLDGNELFTFGSAEWTDDDAFGAVTGIAETDGGILVLDGNYRSIKLFGREGEFLGAVDCDELLGTKYPWPSSMVPTEDGILVAAAQEREDESCDELLIFLVKGF